MYRRKRIAFLTAQIEAVHERNSLDGILRQCQKYDYDLCVFSTMVHLDFPREHYLKGETNIYRLAELSGMDGVILDGTALTGDHTGTIIRMVCERLRPYPELPVCVLQMPIEGYSLIESSNEPILRELCRHIIEVHHMMQAMCSSVRMLWTGCAGISSRMLRCSRMSWMPAICSAPASAAGASPI